MSAFQCSDLIRINDHSVVLLRRAGEKMSLCQFQEAKTDMNNAKSLIDVLRIVCDDTEILPTLSPAPPDV